MYVCVSQVTRPPAAGEPTVELRLRIAAPAATKLAPVGRTRPGAGRDNKHGRRAAAAVRVTEQGRQQASPESGRESRGAGDSDAEKH